MNNEFENLFSSDLFDKPFKNNSEYLNTQLLAIKMLISDYLRAKKIGFTPKFKKDALSLYYDACIFIRARINISEGIFFAGERIKKIYNLSVLDWFCVLIGVLTKLDDKYKKIFLEIQGGQKLSYESVLKLYYFTDNIFEIDDYINVHKELSAKMDDLCFSGEDLKIDSRVFENIVNNARSDQNVPGMFVRIPQKNAKPLIIREKLAKKIENYIKNQNFRSSTIFYIKGIEGIGKRTIIGRVCDILDKVLISVNFKKLMPFGADLAYSFVKSAYREALFEEGYICLENFEKVVNEKAWDDARIDYILRKALNFSPIVFILSSKKDGEVDTLRPYLEKYKFIDISLDELNTEENFKVWEYRLNNVNLKKDPSLDIHEISNKFIFTPKQIINTVTQAENQILWCADDKPGVITDKFLCEIAYKQITGKLSDKATLIKKKHAWDELVMKKEQKEIIRRACDQIKYKHIVYDKWGMNKRILYGRGLSMLFTGPPGTGKTMAAQVVANELGLEIYKVDLSKVISKYIGESEKNLGEVFDSAKRSNVILLFDETDALFGKRTEVKDSHDKNANVETSYLLQKMEEYDGITIMTTNFIENIDKAFFRRISYVIHFNFPDIESRKEIWKKMFPKETPLDKDIDFDFLSKNFEIAGGSIKNAVITSTFMAAAESSSVGMKHIIKALEYEIKKQGKIVSKNDFGEYGYLLKK